MLKIPIAISLCGCGGYGIFSGAIAFALVFTIAGDLFALISTAAKLGTESPTYLRAALCDEMAATQKDLVRKGKYVDRHEKYNVLLASASDSPHLLGGCE